MGKRNEPRFLSLQKPVCYLLLWVHQSCDKYYLLGQNTVNSGVLFEMMINKFAHHCVLQRNNSEFFLCQTILNEHTAS